MDLFPLALNQYTLALLFLECVLIAGVIINHGRFALRIFLLGAGLLLYFGLTTRFFLIFPHQPLYLSIYIPIILAIMFLITGAYGLLVRLLVKVWGRKYGLLSGTAIFVLANCGLVMPVFLPAFAGFLLTFVEDVLHHVLFVLAVVFAWAGVCYLFLRFARPETEARMRIVLKFFSKSKKNGPSPITVTTVREMISGGWGSTWMACVVLSMKHGDWAYMDTTVGIVFVFFGGLFFALGWYGLRCLRLLGVDSLNPNDDLKAS